MSKAADSFRALFPEQFLHKFIAGGVRPDARQFASARETSFNAGMIRTADGSSMVQLGNTTVVAGVTLSTFRPTVGCADCGKLSVVVELGAVCSSRFSGGKPSDQAPSLSNFLAETLRQARVVDLQDLIIKKGAAAYVLNVAVTCLNYDGNVEDAALFAAVLALLDTKLPVVVVHETGQVVECDGEPTQLRVRCLPIGVTQALVSCAGEKVTLLDPTAEEEEQSQGSFSVVLVVPLPLNAKSDPAETTNSAPIMLHKPGGLGLSIVEVKGLLAGARKRAAELLPLLLKICP